MNQSFYAALVAAALTLATSPALASDEEIIALSEQSARAFAEGRYAEADAAGEAAWRQAEIEWGAVEDTAFLADNLTRQRLALDQREAAREPAARVLELAEAGLTPSMKVEEAQLAVTLAAFDPATPSPESLAALESALIAVEGAGVAPGQLVWTGWLNLASAYYAQQAWAEAYAAGQNVMNVMDLSVGVPDAARVAAAVTSGVAAAENKEYAAAVAAFSWGIDYLPKFIEADETQVLNPDWARLVVWADAADAIRMSLNQESLTQNEDVFGLDGMTAESICPNAIWIVRERLNYPDMAAMRGQVGAALVEYELGANGRVQNSRIVAEAPEAGFGVAMLNALRGWRAEPDSVADCVGKKLLVRAVFGF